MGWGVAFATLVLAAGVGAGAGAAAAAGPAWTTYRHDAARSGIDPDSTSPVSPSQIWQSQFLDGPVYGQPLVYGSNVYVATENDTIYSLNAADGSVAWSKHLATPVPAGRLPCGDIGPNVGITSTPVIDPATNAIYVVADTWDGSNSSSIQHKLFGLNVADGSPTAGLPQAVDPDPPNAAAQLQRVGLGLEAGKIIIGYGGNAGDCPTYHGWLVAVPEAGGALQTFEVDSATSQGAIWASGNAPPIDASGNIWTSTGNGGSGAYGYQESVVKLGPSLGPPLDSWAPSDWATLDSSDADIGSSMPVLLPGNLAYEDGKNSVGYLLDSTHLGGIGAEVFQASVCASFGGGIYLNGVIYVSCSNGMRALSLDTTNRRFSTLSSWTVNSSAKGPPIFAGGLVWSTGWSGSTLYGLDPATGATKFSANLGGFEHFTTPSAGGGNLYVASNSVSNPSTTPDRVTAFHIASYTPPSPTPTPTPNPTPTPTPTPTPRPVIPKLTHLHATVVGHKLRISFTLSEAATVTIRLGQRKWTRRVKAGHDSLLVRWGKLSRGRHRLFVVATDAARHRSQRQVVHFRYRPKVRVRPKVQLRLF
jgi:outer membrane protein assembly factor BamB